MRRFMIIWFCMVFILGCSFTQQETKKDPLINTYVVNSDETLKANIEKDLNFFLAKHERKWSKENKKKCVNLLLAGQKEFEVDYKIVLSIISIESEFDVNAVGKKYRHKKLISKDYGLTQQNYKYYARRYKASEEYLKRYGFKYTNSKFDMGKNIFSCFMYLRDITDTPDLMYFRDYITAYNWGVKGVKRSDDEYYDKFMRAFLSI